MSTLRIGLIGGSGLGAEMGRQAKGVVHVIDTPFGAPSAPIIETIWNDIPVYFLARHGIGHTINPSQINNRANIFAFKKLGVTHILASGAVGSLRDEYKPRDLVIPDQIIDKTHRASTFYEKAAVHVEFAEPFCPILRQIIMEAASTNVDPALKETPTVHDGGCYVCMEGPAFSTRAESLMHRIWGGDLIGMTAMPEAKLAKEAEIAYALIALVTDYDCWKHVPVKNETTKPDPFALLNEIMGHLKVATDHAIGLMKKTVEAMAAQPGRLADCPAREALKLGIWTEKSHIDRDEVQRLWPMWGKYM